jgi:hypothetical protein
MKWLQPYEIFLEQKNQFLPKAEIEIKSPFKYNSKNLISELCIGMLILNNNFLDDLLDRGMKARYSENSQVFLSDLKTMLLNKNRLQLGKFDGDICVQDEDTSKLTNIFDNIDFEIEKDWSVLIDARIYARNICDKILQDDKLLPETIRSVYWVGLSDDKTHPEDLVIELESGQQLGIVLNKGISNQKTSSFNTFGDEILGVDLDTLYKGEYVSKWDKLIQDWVKINYENANKNIQIHIEKFIEPDRIDGISYFEFFDIKHKDLRFKNIGEHIKEFDKNILYFSDLLNEIWKNRDMCFMDSERIYKEWMEKKIFILNSKILEHLFTESLLKNYPGQITKQEDGLKTTDGDIKMRLMKIIVNKLGCLERPLYLFSSKGNNMDFIPSRDLFRKFYDDFELSFDYHVKMVIDTEDEEINDFKIKMVLDLDGDRLMDILISINFSGGEVSSKLSSKFKFTPVPDFNYVLTSKMKQMMNED